ncbi:uncharacterized protein LOC143029798 isoform X2 [Oratosquilla oratoria]|uniref:uncharacterized protein LOC143029798 isoform X2 n=1 Tax=Oratosquilla oratoria TaxID=337810 RepID=UPI003F759BD0
MTQGFSWRGSWQELWLWVQDAVGHQEVLIQLLQVEVTQAQQQRAVAAQGHLTTIHRLMGVHEAHVGELTRHLREGEARMTRELARDVARSHALHTLGLDRLDLVAAAASSHHAAAEKEGLAAFHTALTHASTALQEELSVARAEREVSLEEAWARLVEVVRGHEARTAGLRSSCTSLARRVGANMQHLEQVRRATALMQREMSSWQKRLAEGHGKVGGVSQERRRLRAALELLRSSLALKKRVTRSRLKAANTRSLAVCEALEKALTLGQSVVELWASCARLETPADRAVPFLPQTIPLSSVKEEQAKKVDTPQSTPPPRLVRKTTPPQPPPPFLVGKTSPPPPLASSSGEVSPRMTRTRRPKKPSLKLKKEMGDGGAFVFEDQVLVEMSSVDEGVALSFAESSVSPAASKVELCSKPRNGVKRVLPISAQNLSSRIQCTKGSTILPPLVADTATVEQPHDHAAKTHLKPRTIERISAFLQQEATALQVVAESRPPGVPESEEVVGTHPDFVLQQADQLLDTHEDLRNFWRKYHNVQLEWLSLRQEARTLQQEREWLRGHLRDYMVRLGLTDRALKTNESPVTVQPVAIWPSTYRNSSLCRYPSSNFGGAVNTGGRSSSGSGATGSGIWRTRRRQPAAAAGMSREDGSSQNFPDIPGKVTEAQRPCSLQKGC